MSDLRSNLTREFGDEEYRYGYAESFLNSKLAMQIKVLREQRESTQAELAQKVGTKQAGFSRFESVDHANWKTETLWKIAKALGVRLNISFETFGSLIDEKEQFSREYLERPAFEDDVAFHRSEHSGRKLRPRERHGRRQIRRSPKQELVGLEFGGIRDSQIVGLVARKP